MDFIIFSARVVQGRVECPGFVRYHRCPGLQDGGSVDKPLSWKSAKTRWQKTLRTFSTNFGSAPDLATVYGPEGAVTVAVEVR